MPSSIEVRVLGPLEVLIDGCPLKLGSATEKALIVYLALHPGRPVSTDVIIDALWGEQAPATAREMVRTYVARVRKRCGDLVRTRSGGYALELPPEAVDAFRFEGLVETGLRESDPIAGAGILKEALELWRGSPLAELSALPGGGADAARLEEMRLGAIERRVEHELALGRSTDLVPELESLVRENPYRERLRAHLMLALYRAGRQTEALERYLEGRRLLVEEIGIEPSRSLQEMQAAILRQDPALDLPPHEPVAPAIPGPALQESSAMPRASATPRALAHRSRGPGAAPAISLRVLSAALVIAGLVVAILIVTSGTASETITRRSVGVIDPRSGQVVAAAVLTRDPGPIAAGRNAVWIGDGASQAVLNVTPVSLSLRQRVKLGTFPYQITSGRHAAWVGDGFYGTVTRITEAGGVSTPFRPEPTSTGRLALVYGDGSLWVGSQDGGLSRVEPVHDRTVTVVHGVGRPAALALAGGAVWVAEAASDAVLRVGMNGRRAIRSVPIGGVPSDVASDGRSSVWAVTPDNGVLWRIDARTAAVTASIDVGPGFSFVAAVDGRVWVASPRGSLEQVDPQRGSVVRTTELDGPINGLAAGNGKLWVSVG